MVTHHRAVRTLAESGGVFGADRAVGATGSANPGHRGRRDARRGHPTVGMLRAGRTGRVLGFKPAASRTNPPCGSAWGLGQPRHDRCSLSTANKNKAIRTGYHAR